MITKTREMQDEQLPAVVVHDSVLTFYWRGSFPVVLGV